MNAFWLGIVAIFTSTVKSDVVRCSLTDCTDIIQKALNETKGELVFEAQTYPTRPVFVSRDDLVISFEGGAELLAVRGAFKGIHDMLFTIRGSSNITLRNLDSKPVAFRMWQQDYVNSSIYNGSQWRHAFSVYDSSDIFVRGPFEFAKSGGDGLYLDGLFGGEISEVTSEGNFRNAMSIIEAENLLIDSCVFANTTGTAPRAGIDMEPNGESNSLVNITVLNSTSVGNEGDGFSVSISALTNESKPVSVLFDQCTAKGDFVGSGLNVLTFRDGANQPSGTVMFENGFIQNTKNPGLAIATDASTLQVFIRNTTINHTAYAHYYWSPITISPSRAGPNRTWPAGGLFIDNLSTLIDSTAYNRTFLDVCPNCANVHLDNTTVISKNCSSSLGPDPASRNISIQINCIHP